jgi:hypothetical protein
MHRNFKQLSQSSSSKWKGHIIIELAQPEDSAEPTNASHIILIIDNIMFIIVVGSFRTPKVTIWIF